MPAEFWRLAGLRILGLSDNRLEAIPPFLLRTLKIVVLRIDGNRAPDYVVKHSSGMVLPGVVMPVRVCMCACVCVCMRVRVQWLVFVFVCALACVQVCVRAGGRVWLCGGGSGGGVGGGGGWWR